MIFFSSKGSTVYSKVWEVTPAENGKYIDLQISTSEKDQEGNYKNSSWFARAIGHSVNTLKGVKRGDRIKITQGKLTNERYKDKDGNMKSSPKVVILEAEIEADNTQNDTTVNSAAPESAEKDDGIPW